MYALASAPWQGERLFLIGSDDEHVYALNRAGRLVWKYKAKVSEWMAFNHRYWTMGNKAKVRRVLAADVEGDGKLDILIGTGGAAIERLDEAGKPRWLFTFKYGTPRSLVLADVRADHPGKELVAGTFDCSYGPVIRYMDWQEGAVQYTAAFRPHGSPKEVSVGDLRTDANACSYVRHGERTTYWELRQGSYLRVGDEHVTRLDSRRDACWDR